jgi:hypothetical protein
MVWPPVPRAYHCQEVTGHSAWGAAQHHLPAVGIVLQCAALRADGLLLSKFDSKTWKDIFEGLPVETTFDSCFRVEFGQLNVEPKYNH